MSKLRLINQADNLIDRDVWKAEQAIKVYRSLFDTHA